MRLSRNSLAFSQEVDPRKLKCRFLAPKHWRAHSVSSRKPIFAGLCDDCAPLEKTVAQFWLTTFGAYPGEPSQILHNDLNY